MSFPLAVVEDVRRIITIHVERPFMLGYRIAEASARVMSVARVHDSLYQAENLEEVDLGQTIEILCQDLSGMAVDGQRVDIVTTEKMMVPYERWWRFR